MAAEAAIRITADGKAVVTAAQQANQALQGISTQAEKTATSLKGTTRSSEGLSAAMRDMDKSAAGGGTVFNLLAKGATMAATAFVAAGAALGSGFVGKLLTVQREFDALNSSMVTVTGSSANAAREMAWIKTFAKETPFGLEQAANAFVKMKSLGLDPSQKALTSYGNTASAMGKDLSQMIEAVADASTGEFERLKEFGIKAKKEGDNVSLTFQGVTTSIGNNSAEITRYLQAIGEKEFGGAMAERAKTLDGAISGLSDSWDELFRTIGSAGVSQALTNELGGLDNYLTSLTDHMNNAKASGAGMVSELSSGMGYIIARAPFDVLSSSANLLNGTLNLLTGGALGLNTSVNLLPDAFKASAQQAVAMAQDLKRAEVEFAALKAQSDKQGSNIYIQSELAALAKYITKLKEAQTQKAQLTGTSADPREASPAMTRGASYARWDQEQAESAKALADERIKASGINKDYFSSLKTYQTALRAGLLTEKEYITAVSELAKKTYEGSTAGREAAKTSREGSGASKEAAAAERERAKAYEAVMKAAVDAAAVRNAEINSITAYMQAEEQARINTVKAANDSVRAAQDEYDNYGKTKSQIAEVTLARLNDKLQAVNAGTEIAASIGREIEAQEQLIGILQKGEVREAGVKAATDADAEWQKASDQINQSLTDALFRAFESGKGFFSTLWDGIKNLFKTTAMRLLINPVASGLTGALRLGGAANAATGGSGGGSILGAAGNLNTANSMLNGSFLNSAGSFGGLFASNAAYGAAIGTTSIGAGSQAAMLAAQTGQFGLAGVTATSSAAGGAMGGATAALSAIPVWGWVALAAIAVAGMFGGRGKKEATGGGIEGNFSSAGFAGNNFNTWKQDGGWFHSDRTGKDTGNLDPATAKQFGDAYGAVRQSATQAAASLGLSADAITNYSQSISLQLGTDAAANEKAVAAMFAGIGDNMALAAAPGIALLSKEGEAAGQTMARLSTSITTANAWLSILRQRLFQVSLAGGDAASKLADAFGGLENLSAASKSFYELYYTEGERAARSQQDMAQALASVNLAMPTTKDGLRELAGSLDLNTEAGRNAYAVLLAIAPEFAVAADLASKFSQEMAAKLVKTFTGGGALVPALDVAALKTVLLADTLISTYAVAGSISLLFLDVNSGLLTFGDRTSTLTGGLTGAQLAALQLTGQIDALHQGADRTRIDFVGLTAALEGVDTETFANTVALVFDSLAARIGGVIDSIGAERIAVREAALQIINPTVMGKDAITRAIAAINVSAPNNAALVAAQQALGRADATVGAQKSAVDYARSLAPSRAALDAAGGTLGAANTRINNANAGLEFWRTTEGGKFRNNVARAFVGDFEDWRVPWAGEVLAGNAVREYLAAESAQQQAQAAYATQTATYNNAVAANAAQIATAQASLSAAAAAQAAAVTAARTAQTAYIASLQDFSIDASKAVGKLGKLREETVKYYEAQKQLADLMGSSAAGLRTTVADYRYSQLTSAQQFDKLQSDFAKNYAMGLSTSGEALAGYGDKLSAGLNPLLEKAREVLTGSAYDAFASTALARAETIAGRLETLTPTDYAADSLAMLGQIDATLAALDASSKSAEKIISDAVSAGADKTANGLRAVIAALTGQAIPAFATGGMHMGGARLVGEYGPEIEVTGPSRIYSAAQTRSMLGGSQSDNSEVVAELRALRQDNANMRAELRAIAVSSKKLVDYADRADVIGVGVRNQGAEPLQVVPA